MKRVQPKAVGRIVVSIAVTFAAICGLGQAGSIVVTDAGWLFSGVADGAVYRIPENGPVVTLASGQPLASPSGIIAAPGDSYYVADLGQLFSPSQDGAVFQVGEDGSVETIYSGEPLAEPYGLLRRHDELLVADFDDFAPSIYALDLDPDDDGKDGPFPLNANHVRTVTTGPPLVGPNQMIKWHGHRILVADDSGFVYEIDLEDEVPVPTVFGPSFGDPVGIAKATIPASSSLPGAAIVVVDGLFQEVSAVDGRGENTALLLGGAFGQLLGIDTGDGGRVAVAHPASLFSTATDGEIVVFDRGSVGVAYAGSPLVNPFAVLFVPGN